MCSLVKSFCRLRYFCTISFPKPVTERILRKTVIGRIKYIHPHMRARQSHRTCRRVAKVTSPLESVDRDTSYILFPHTSRKRSAFCSKRPPPHNDYKSSAECTLQTPTLWLRPQQSPLVALRIFHRLPSAMVDQQQHPFPASLSPR